MEQWELQIQGFPALPEPRVFAKAIQTAADVLKGDLADFETERLFHTFLEPPVDLLSTVLNNFQEEEWSNAIIEAFKMLGTIAGKYVNALDPYFENIVKICQLPHMPHVRRQALLCLAELAPVTRAAATDAVKLAAEMENATTCKTERALLVGTLCEFHPEMLENQATRIWRTYLSFLGCNGLTDKFVSKVLEGISGLLVSFGRSLPVSELWEFYDTLVRLHARCRNVCIAILGRHAPLFKERIADDVRTRAMLWSLSSLAGVADALISVYEAVAEVKGNDIKVIIEQEVLPQLSVNKVPALCVLSSLRGRGFESELEGCVDVQRLEFELRSEAVSYYTADLITWYIRTGLAHSLRLSQTALLFYQNIPAKKVNDLAAAILKQPHVREEAISFLAAECSQPGADSAGHMPAWRALLVDAGSEQERGDALKEYMKHFTFVLDTWIEEDNDVLPEKLAVLLTLSTDILSLPVADVHVEACLATLSAALRQCRAAELLAGTHAVLRRGGRLQDDVWKLIRLDSCRDEASLCACCLLLLHAAGWVDNKDILKALQIIFTRHDVEDTTLLQAVKNLEDLIGGPVENGLEAEYSQAIRLVQKLQNRKAVDKDARILQRSITMFLGKYGNKIDVNNNENGISVVTSKLKDSLFLAIPHLEAERVKINLQEIIQLAIEQEDPDSLQQLLKISCASASTRREPAVLSALSLLCVALCRGAAGDCVRGPVQRALRYCDSPPALHDLLALIGEEPSPGVRKLLCSCLPAILSDELMASTLSRAADMMGGQGTTKCAGMDIIDALLPSLEDNHSILKSHLPHILESIAKTNELESMSTFKKTSKLFINKLALFEIEDVEDLIRKLIQHLMIGSKIKKNDIKTYKSISEMCVQISKAATDAGKMDSSRTVEMIFEFRESDFFKSLYVLAIVRNRFEFDPSYCSTVFFNKTLLDVLYSVDISFSEDDTFQLEAILFFMTEYAETLLEFNYEKTTQLLSSIVLKIPPHSVVTHQRSLFHCLSTYKRILRTFPKVLDDSFECWLLKLPLRGCRSDPMVVKALNIYLDATGFYLHSLMETLKTWPKQILKTYIGGVGDDQLSHLSDCLTAAVRVTGFNVKCLLLEGKVANDFIGVRFCAAFMKILLKCFLKKPYVLLEDDAKECCVVLDDVVKYCVRRKCGDEVYEQVLDLVNEVWSTYDAKTSFHQKCDLLSNVSCLPKGLGRESNPMRWVAAQLSCGPGRGGSAGLVAVLPGGEEFADCYSSFAVNCLSATLSECNGATLRAALDALAAKPSLTLLKIVATLANTDEESQDRWWEKALDSCSASLARCERFNACDALLASDDAASLGVCRRLMLPLLRYSTSTYCERFFSRHLRGLLDSLTKKPRDTRATGIYQRCLVERTRALLLLQVAFEKIPLASLQSPQSALYGEWPRPPAANYLTSAACKLCVTLRKEGCPADADDKFRDTFRRYQSAIYNCLCAAICKSKPADKFYEHIVGPAAWGKLSDDGDRYDLPIHKRRRKTRHPVSISVASSTAGPTATPATARTKMFLRTLSEDPHKFDLYNEETEEVEIQELQMPDSEINKHPSAGTLTALLAHTSGLSCWRGVCAQVTHTLQSQPNYLLAQCVCNCHVALSPHAISLRPALLAFTANTLQDGRLNGLHVDILETLTHWRETPSLPDASLKHLQVTVEALIKEAIESRDPFLLLLEAVLDVYSQFVTVSWSVLSTHIHNHNWKCLPVIQKLAKHKIRIPELVPTLVQIDLKHWLQDIKISEIFGAALSCERERDSAIQSFRDMLKRVRQSEGYVKMLYYAQLGCKEICDEVNFRQVTDQTRKLPKPLQNKCLHILSTYISLRPIDYSTSMFDTIELSEFLTTDNVEALDLVANGLRLMEEGLKRRVVNQALEYCGHSVEKVRKAAFTVAATAFEELFYTKTEDEPSAKKRKKSHTLLNILHETDPYVLNVVARAAQGVTSYNGDVTTAVKKVLRRNAGERLAECFALLLMGNITNLTACAPLLDVFFAELRANDSFLSSKLRDEPLEPIEPKGPSNLFTDTKSCRGTLLSYRAGGASRRLKPAESPVTEVDVQVSIDSILHTLLQFAKKDPRVALALVLQTVRCLPGRGFDFQSALASLLTAKLATPSDASPLYIQLGRVVIDKGITTQGFEEAVGRLEEIASRSDDADVVRCLYEELQMRRNLGIFELRSASMPHHDVTMEESQRFSMQELGSCFGQLSDWDDLTTQQRAARRGGLPALWTDEGAFKEALEAYKVSARGDGWFESLVSSYCDDTKHSARWLLDARRWPRRRFHESAVAEALSWQLDCEPWTCQMSSKDCLIEWSARLMIRSAQASEREAIYPSHSNELLWCVRANEIALHQGVLQCCERNNAADIPKEDKISWHYQKLLALRGMALERNDSHLLKEALDTAVTLVSSSPDRTPDSIGIYKLYLEQNLNELTSNDINNILEKVNKPDTGSFAKSRRALTSLYEMALIHCDRQWADDATKQDEVITNLAFILYRMRESNLGPKDQHLAVILNRLTDYGAAKIEDDEVKNQILQVLHPQEQYFDDFTAEQIRSLGLLGKSSEDHSKRDFKQFFAAIRDVGHCLLKYCEGLVKAVSKKEIWSEIFERIKDMMENPYVGSDYHLLKTQQDKLYGIADFDSTNPEKKLEVLRSVMVALDQPAKSHLRISQLCPSLLKCEEMAKWLIGDVVRVEDQVSVITTSIRRPCVVTVLTSRGARARFVHKAGESLLRDASVLRADPTAKYKVIPTSADSGLMDYLEDHETLYSLISSVCNLDQISASVQRPYDEELIVTPSPHTFQQLRVKVPVHALRTAIERNSSCFEDFLMKKKNFQDSLATTAVINWILGLGDRHLENLMCSLRTGHLVSIDCGAALSFVRELPPARLTPGLLALTDTRVLESRLQTALAQFRESRYLFCNFVKMTFKWSGAEIEHKFPYIQALVWGRSLSHHVSRALLAADRRPYREAYLQLMDDVFAEGEQREEYTVVEQISSFLVHCSSPRILHVTRAGWTPWV